MADVDDADDHKVVLNEDNLSSSPQNESGVDAHENVYFQDLPDALIVTNLEECIFDDVNCKVGTRVFVLRLNLHVECLQLVRKTLVIFFELQNCNSTVIKKLNGETIILWP